MWDLLDIGKVIGMKMSGTSTREINRKTGYDREKISRVWSRYCAQTELLGEEGADIRSIQEEMKAKPKYNSSKRERRKYTAKIAERLKEIVEVEERKKRRLGKGHKQRLTNQDIHGILVEEGHDISRVTINIELAKLRNRQKEVYIRQQYDFGDRLEYDFGEVRLNCGEGVKTYHMAVLSSPASNFKWAYLYTNQKQGVFMDSHVKFFEMTGGVWKEVVYDNMRNVVRKFIGKNDKELNKELMQMAMYYGYQINVTNCFKGNEKGHVENSVKTLRRQMFNKRDTFASLDEAREYMHSQLLKLNEDSRIEEEKQNLLPYRPPLELAVIGECKASPYSFISVDTAFYSVPEHLVGHTVTVKKYHDEIRVYAGNELVCRHPRIFGNGKTQVDISHYLNTLMKKPGAIRNSVALKSIPRLKAIFDTHYINCPKKFIEIYIENKELPIDELIMLFEEKTRNRAEVKALDVVKPISRIEVSARAAMINYTTLIYKGVMAYDDGAGVGVKVAAYVHTG
jgi:hypothetical protein